MSARSFREKVIKDFIQIAIEDSWNRDDEDEYLAIGEKEWLVNNNALLAWKQAYFHDLVNNYQGSCNSISPKDESFLEEFDMFGDLDNEIFECGTCGWWYDSSEEGESSTYERTCEDCCKDEEE